MLAASTSRKPIARVQKVSSELGGERDNRSRVLLLRGHPWAQLSRNEVQDLTIQMYAIGAASDGTAIDVLVHLDAVHEFAGKTGNGRDDVFVGTRGGCAKRFGGPSSYRNKEQIIFASFPAQAISRVRRHSVEQERRIVVRSNTSIHEYKRLRLIGWIPLHDLWRKEDRSGGAGADQLPQRNLQITILACGIIVFCVRVTADRPRRVGRHVLGDD